ncbi:MAG: ABC transporter ATP-binding protein, partial [Pseudomonadota bacterium]
QISPSVEQIYRRIGALDTEEKFHMKRIFEISVHPRPWRCVPMICEWTKKSYLMTTAGLIYTSMTLPKYLKESNRKFHEILDLAKKDNVSPEKLIGGLPVDLPYRKEPEIRELLAGLGLENCHFDFHDECITARYYKSPLFTTRKEDARKSRPRASEEAEPVIKAKDLCKRYGKAKHYAVDRLNFSIGSAAIFGILGPNGAGKTTTLMMLCGLLEPSKGTIRFYRGGDPVNGREIKRMIGFVPQDLALYLKLTARENLRYFAGLYGMHGESLARRVDELLELVGLRERADELVNHYSSGMKRRLNLAVGLIHEPMIIFLDEPTVGIDPQSRNCIFESVSELKNKGATILYTTHYMEEANKLCDRIAIMDRGKILLEGRPSELVGRFGLGRLVFKTDAAVPGSFIKALAALDSVHNTDQSPKRLTINTAGNAEENVRIIEDILKVAAQHGVDMSLINIVEPTLESLFLDITGRDFRDSEDEGTVEQVFTRING